MSQYGTSLGDMTDSIKSQCALSLGGISDCIEYQRHILSGTFLRNLCFPKLCTICVPYFSVQFPRSAACMGTAYFHSTAQNGNISDEFQLWLPVDSKYLNRNVIYVPWGAHGRRGWSFSIGTIVVRDDHCHQGWLSSSGADSVLIRDLINWFYSIYVLPY